jgi:hypothetical protein
MLRLKSVRLFLILLLFAVKGLSQQPVQASPQLLPPYSLQVSDYYGGVQPKMQLMLLNRDINQPTIIVKLKMTVQSQNCSMQTKATAVTQSFTLVSGVPYYLQPQELQTYFDPSNLDFGGGYSQQEYVTTGRFPEGLYTFTFEAYEIVSGNTVSNKGFAMAWLTLADPPLLNTPAKAEGVTPTNPQNIVFNWTPRHNTSPTAAYYTDYVFTLSEYNDLYVGPEASFNSTPPIYIDSVQTTTYLYGPDKPQLVPGKRYSWRVQAKARNGSQQLAMFRNNGFSEVYWFTYQNNCPVPLGISATPVGQRVTIEWQNNPQHIDYKIEYREKNNPDAQWFTVRNSIPRIVLTDLKPSTQYEYRIGGSCIEDVYTYSVLMAFTTNGDAVNAVLSCGDSSLPVPGAAQTLQTLATGSVLHAGSFDVTVGYTTGSGSFTGMGYVIVPWLMNAKVEVRFTNITLSADYKLLSGIIETTYDVNESGVDDIDEYIDVFAGGHSVGGVLTGLLQTDTTLTITIAPLTGTPPGISLPPGFNPANPTYPITVTIYPQGGGSPQTIPVTKLPYTIQDKDGNIYQVGSNGSVTKLASPGGQGILERITKNNIDNDRGLVTFMEDPNGKYAFDAWRKEYNKSNAFSKEYERLKLVLNNGLQQQGADGSYYVGAKAIAPGETEPMLVKLQKPSGSTINMDSVQFITGKGSIYTSQKLTDSTFRINILGGPASDAQEIYAVYPQVGGKNWNLGKLMVASYGRKQYNLKLVKVNGTNLNTDSIQSAFSRTYERVNIKLVLNAVDTFSIAGWDLNNDGKIDVLGSNLFSKYSSEMYAIKELYKKNRILDNNNFCVFLMPQSNSSVSGLAGEMVRGSNVGFLFANQLTDNNVGPVIAHELGHGTFNLRHTYDEYGFQQTDLQDNLLNNFNALNLTKHQWDLLHDPSIAISLFDDQKDEQYVIANGSIQSVFAEFSNKGTFANTYSFLTPAGKPITLPGNAEAVRFSTKDPIVSSDDVPTGEFSPIGAVTGFKKDGKSYIAKYANKTFIGYYNEENNNDYYFEDVTYNLKPANAIIGLPWYTDKLLFTAFQISIKPETSSAAYNRNSSQKYVGHGIALINHFSIIDYLKKGIDPNIYSGFSDEYVTLMAESWKISAPRKFLENTRSNINFSKGALEYLYTNKSFIGEGSLLAPLIISNAFYLSWLSANDANTICFAASRLKEFTAKISQLALNTSTSSFTREKLDFLDSYYKELKTDLSALNLNNGTTATRDINELIQQARNSQQSFLNDLFPILENECLYSNITQENRIMLVKKLLKYAEQLTHESNPPFPFSLFNESPESVCKKVMHYIIALIDNSKYSNQQNAIVNQVFCTIPNSNSDYSDNYLSTLYLLGNKPYPWLRNNIMEIFSLISNTLVTAFTKPTLNFSFDATGGTSFDSRIDYQQKKIYLKRNGTEYAYDINDLVSVVVPTSNAFIVFDENQSGVQTYKVPAILLHHLIRVQNIDQDWRNEYEQKMGAVRILTDIVVMIAAIPTDGASVTANAMVWYWISGADLIITFNKDQLSQSEIGKAVLDNWDKLVALVAVYQLGEYLVIENGNRLVFKAQLFKSVIKQKLSQWTGIEQTLRKLIETTSRVNLSYYSASLLTRTQLEIENLVLTANFSANNATAKVGINVNNTLFVERNGAIYNLMTMEGSGSWYGNNAASKTVISGDEKLGSVTKGRFLKANGQVAEQTYDIYYRTATNETFVAVNGKHINWVEVQDIANKVELKADHTIRTLDLNPNGTGYTGGHSHIAFDNYIATHPGSSVVYRNQSYDIASGTTNVDRVYEAEPVIIGADGIEIGKINNSGKSTMFPDNWTESKIKQEVQYAIENNFGKDLSSSNPREYYGLSSDGKVQINFYYNSDGSIGSYFPKKR